MHDAFAVLCIIMALLSPRRKQQRGLRAAEFNLHGQPPPGPPWHSVVRVAIGNYQLKPPRRGGRPPLGASKCPISNGVLVWFSYDAWLHMGLIPACKLTSLVSEDFI